MGLLAHQALTMTLVLVWGGGAVSRIWKVMTNNHCELQLSPRLKGPEGGTALDTGIKEGETAGP